MDEPRVGCTGKVAHKAKGDAMKAIRNLARRHQARESHRGLPEPYRCDVCGAWHVGGRQKR